MLATLALKEIPISNALFARIFMELQCNYVGNEQFKSIEIIVHEYLNDHIIFHWAFSRSFKLFMIINIRKYMCHSFFIMPHHFLLELFRTKPSLIISFKSTSIFKDFRAHKYLLTLKIHNYATFISNPFWFLNRRFNTKPWVIWLANVTMEVVWRMTEIVEP